MQEAEKNANFAAMMTLEEYRLLMEPDVRRAVEVSLPGGAAAALYALMAAATLWDACRKPKKTLTLPR